ncbi:hypothetical protein CcCBS67573_g01113 [Chytriomyces confervae]|uniref:Uncharacterized protein n=1 Tax=Chytriomyces confervae TaxID=246404 RepID=A0A507FMX9_9FUNG|nr:hypothetical protein HDU80_009274 [Chytriomyces hyalinus]TPX77593.1 hypothetical protein CcCBS67573_g01113 [Chytriomyces confervae]
MSQLPIPKTRRSTTCAAIQQQQHQQLADSSPPMLQSPTPSSFTAVSSVSPSDSTVETPFPAPSSTSSRTPSAKQSKGLGLSMRRESSSYSATALSSSNTIPASTPTPTQQPLPEWNSTKIIHAKPASKSVKRSKSYAASLRKTKTGNVIESPVLDEEDGEFVNGQSKTTRSLQLRVAELEGQLDTVTKDFNVVVQQLETAGSEHRYAVDKLKQDCQEQLHEKDLSYAQETQRLGVQVSLLTAEIERAHVKESMQALEIAKLHAQVSEVSQLVTEKEVQVASLGAETEAATRKAGILQAEVTRLQGAVRTAAQTAMEKEVELEARLEESLKEVDVLKGRLVVQKGEHERLIANTQSRIDQELASKEARIAEILNSEAQLLTELESLKSAAVVLESDNGKLRAGLLSSTTRVQTLEISMTEKESMIETHAATILSQNSAIGQLVLESKNLRSQLDDSNKALQVLKEETAQQDVEHSRRYLELEEVTSAQFIKNSEDIANLTSENLQNENALLEKSQAIANLEFRLKESLESVALLNEQMKSSESEKDKALSDLIAQVTQKDQQVLGLTDENNDMALRIQNHIQNIESLKNELETAALAYNQSEAAYQSAASTQASEALQLKLQFEQEANEKDAAISRLTHDLDLLTKHSSKQNDEIEKLTVLLAENEKTLELVHSELISTKMANADASQAIASEMNAMRSEKDETIQSLRVQLSSLSQSLDEKTDVLSSLRSQLEHAHQAGNALKSELATVIADNETQALTVKMQFENKIAQQLQLISELRQEVVVMSLEVEERTANEVMYSADAEAAKKRIDELQSELRGFERAAQEAAATLAIQKDSVISKLTAEVADLNARINLCKIEEKKSEALLIKTSASLDLATKQFEQEKKTHDITKQTLNTQIEEAVAAKQSEIAELKKRATSQDAETDSLRATLATKDAELLKMKRSETESAAMIKTLEAAVSEANSDATKFKEEKIFLTKRLEIVEKNLEIQANRGYRPSRKITSDSVRNSMDRTLRNSVDSSATLPSRLSMSGRDSMDGAGMIPRGRLFSIDSTADEDNKRFSKPPQPQSRPSSTLGPSNGSLSRNSTSASPSPPPPQPAVKAVPTVEATVASFVSDLDSAFNF